MGTRSYWQRCALNTPIQGTAADVLKLAMVRILSKLEEHPYIKPLLTIHDEILFEVPRNKVDEACTIIKECMEQRPFRNLMCRLKQKAQRGTVLGIWRNCNMANYFNSEKYPDPTSYAVMHKLELEEKKSIKLQTVSGS